MLVILRALDGWIDRGHSVRKADLSRIWATLLALSESVSDGRMQYQLGGLPEPEQLRCRPLRARWFVAHPDRYDFWCRRYPSVKAAQPLLYS